MTATRARSLLVQLSPYEPISGRGSWDPASISPAGTVTLASANMDARRTASSGAAIAEVRGIAPVRGGSMVYWETQLRAAVSGQFEAIIGVVSDAAAVLANFAGFDAEGRSVGIDPSGGRIRYKGAIVNIIGGGVTTSDRLRHCLDLDNYSYGVAKGAGGWTWVPLDPLTLAWPWRPICQVAPIASRGWIIYDGLPGSEFLYTPQPGSVPYRQSSEAPHYLHITSGTFPVGVTGGAPSTFLPGRICADQDVEFEANVRSWVHGGLSSSRRGQIVLPNPRGELDYLRAWRWRGIRATLKEALEGDPYSAYTDFGTAIVDNLVALSGSKGTRLSIVLRDLNAGSDVQLQERTYAADHPNTQLRARKRPITIGRPLYCEGKLQSTEKTGTDAYAFEYHDGYRDHNTVGGGLDSVSAVYDRGDVFLPPPTDWGYWPASGPRRGVKLVNSADGKVVANPVGPGEPFGSVVWEYLRNVVYMLYTRGQGLWDSTLSLTALDALQVKSPGRLAAYITEAITAEQAIAQALAGATGWLAPTADGSLVAGRLEDPETMTAVADLTTINCLAPPVADPDDAPNLTARMAGRRNHSPFGSDGDFATSVSPALREELTSEWGVICETTGVLHPMYKHAMTAAPQPTWLQERDDIQREINRVCHLYSIPRMFYRVPAVLDPSLVAAVRGGVAVNLRWPGRYGLDNGRNLLVMGVRTRFFARRMDLVLWGR
jgi:hypothetical protein